MVLILQVDSEWRGFGLGSQIACAVAAWKTTGYVLKELPRPWQVARMEPGIRPEGPLLGTPSSWPIHSEASPRPALASCEDRQSGKLNDLPS